MAMNSYVLSGLGGGGGNGIREPGTTGEPAVALPVTWWKGLGPPGWRGLRLCSWQWGDAVRAGPSGLRRGSAPWFLPQRAASARQSDAVSGGWGGRWASACGQSCSVLT